MKTLRLPHIIKAYQMLAPLLTYEFIVAPMLMYRVEGDTPTFDILRFEIQGFGYGCLCFTMKTSMSESFYFDMITLGDDIRYSSYYKSRHSNRELMYLLEPILLDKLRPDIEGFYPEFFK